jgi:diguanylate cyclase (GGDEF)-like protein/PAS domain S-box-containing protein
MNRINDDSIKKSGSVAQTDDTCTPPLNQEIGTTLQDSEKLYRELFDQVPAGIVVHGPHSEILLANATAVTILGLDKEQLMGRVAMDPAWRFKTENGDIMPVTDFPVNQVLATRSSIRNVVIGVHRPATADIAWVICNAFPRFDDQGQLIQVVVCFTDVTELKEAGRALQKSEERLRLILQGSNDAPWDKDFISNTTYYSPRWWQMIGREPEEKGDTAGLWRTLLHPDDRDRVHQSLKRMLADVDQHSFELEFSLHCKAGHYLPVLCRGFISRDACGKPLRISGTNTDLTERKQAEASIHHLAYYDALTGLPNRRLLIEQLRMALTMSDKTGHKGALLFIDLDNFKALNDTLGHDIGDQLLKLVAERLRETVSKSDYVARIGGDEFVVILENLGEVMQEAPIEAERMGQKILLALNQPFTLLEKFFRSPPSIGITLFDGSLESVDELLKQADVAMYQAKEAGRNTLRFFDPSMQAAVDQRVTLEHDLRDGLQKEQMCLYCQPQVNEDGHLIGGEVLVRWRHPTRGLVAPGLFIPLAEATGLIIPLGEWVLRKSCEHLAAWSADRLLRDIPLAVNISAQQIRQADFVARVLATIEQTGAPPQRLKLELTESLMAENVEDVIAKMLQLKKIGVSFSLDDFGTGYSSLSYLKRFPLEQLKIDQSFVRDVLENPHDATIARIIITLADKLGFQVIAEGVETREQCEFLLENGCHAFQGYLFGRPVPIDEFTTLYQAGAATASG